MAILKVFVFVKFVEVYGAFAFAPSYMCLYTCIVEFLIFTKSTRISEANGITIGVSESNGDIHVQTGQEECSCRSIYM